MGRRSGTETVIAIIACFVRQRSWRQDALAREVGVSTRALRARLDELSQHGVNVSRFEESARDVRWDVPLGWFPDATGLSDDEAASALRLLSRLPASRARDGLMTRLVGRVALAQARALGPRETVLDELEDACRTSSPVRIVYDAASSEPGVRLVTIHRIVHGTPARFVATSHERDRLLWYRVDRVQRVDEAPGVRPIEVDDAVVDAYVRESVNGFRKGAPVRCAFFVRHPEARWVLGNLPVEGARVAPVDGGVEVEVDTGGVEVLARYVVGLGAAARAVSPDLRSRVEAIARGALEGARDTPRTAEPPAPQGATGRGAPTTR